MLLYNVSYYITLRPPNGVGGRRGDGVGLGAGGRGWARDGSGVLAKMARRRRRAEIFFELAKLAPGRRI